MEALDTFFDDERRRGSEERRFGMSWRTTADPRAVFSVFWLAETRELCALRSDITDVKVGGGLTNILSSGEIWTNVQLLKSEHLSVSVLGHVQAEALDEAVTGWESREHEPDGLEWLKGRVH